MSAPAIALLIGLAAWDWLGAVERAELYSALIVDAANGDQARRVLVAAYHDPWVSFGQWKHLKLDFMRSHGPTDFLATSEAFAPVCEGPE